MDNIEKNGINNIDNNISSDTVGVSDGITQTAGESAVINEAEIAPAEVSEVQALPENEAMMAYSEVSSDMPSISAVPSEQPVTVPAPEPSQMDCVSPVGTVSDNPANALGAFAPVSEACDKKTADCCKKAEKCKKAANTTGIELARDLWC